MKAKPASSEARFAYEGLDRVIHERARLSVLTSLITNPKGLTFVDLKQLCGLTDGNLSRHLGAGKGKHGRNHQGPRPQSPADNVPYHRLRPQALSRISIHTGTGSARCRESDQR